MWNDVGNAIARQIDEQTERHSHGNLQEANEAKVPAQYDNLQQYNDGIDDDGRRSDGQSADERRDVRNARDGRGAKLCIDGKCDAERHDDKSEDEHKGSLDDLPNSAFLFSCMIKPP